MHFLGRSAGVVVGLARSSMLLALVAGVAGPTSVATFGQTEAADPAVLHELPPTGDLRAAAGVGAGLEWWL